MANRHKHRSNKRIDHSLGFVPCEVCMVLTGDESQCMGAIATHEIFYRGSAYARNTSTDYGASYKVCDMHHKELHAHKDGPLSRRLQVREQMRIMEEFNLTTEQWIEIFIENYL